MRAAVAAASHAVTRSVRTLVRLPDTLLGRLVDHAWARIFAELEARQRREWVETLAFLARWQPEHLGVDQAAATQAMASSEDVGERGEDIA